MVSPADAVHRHAARAIKRGRLEIPVDVLVAPQRNQFSRKIADIGD